MASHFLLSVFLIRRLTPYSICIEYSGFLQFTQYMIVPKNCLILPMIA